MAANPRPGSELSQFGRRDGDAVRSAALAIDAAHIVFRREGRIAAKDAEGEVYWQRIRDFEAATWRRARAELRAHPQRAAILSELEGTVVLKPELRGKRRVIVRAPPHPEYGEFEREYLVPPEWKLLVAEGDAVRACEPLCEGEPALADFLRIIGSLHLARWLSQTFQVLLGSEHLQRWHVELLFKALLVIRVMDPGDASHPKGTLLAPRQFNGDNDALKEKGDRQMIGEWHLLGLSQLEEFQRRTSR